MHADVEGAVRIARQAADFDWTWTVENLEQFCRVAGWQQPVSSEYGYGAEIQTNVSASPPAAFAEYDSDFYGRTSLPEGEVSYVAVALTDSMPGDSHEVYEALLDTFSEMTARLVAEFDQPVRLDGDRPKVLWDLPGLVSLVLELAFDRQNIVLRIANTWYHDDKLRSNDSGDDEDDEELYPMADTWPSSSEWSESSAELALGLARLPSGGVIQLTVDGKFAALFAMDLFKLTCVISVGEGQRQGAEPPEALRLGLIDRGWSAPNPDALSVWQRSIRWPAGYAEYLTLADNFLLELATLHPTASPSDVEWYAAIDLRTVGSVGWGTLRLSN